jgi:hypothetical protein
MIKIDYFIKQKSSKTVYLRIKVYTDVLVLNKELKIFNKSLKEENKYVYVHSTWYYNIKEIEPIAKICNNPNLIVLYFNYPNDKIKAIARDLLTMMKYDHN